MKRILALLLVLAMCLSLFAGCKRKQTDETQPSQETKPTETVPAVDEKLEKALEYLRVFYKDAAVKTPMDYTRLGSVRIGTASYPIVWSVDADEEIIQIVLNEDGTYTIDINEEAVEDSTEPIPYVLTATITGTDGRELTLSWNHVIPAAIDEEAIEIVKAAYELQPGQSLEGTHTLTGVIITIDTMYDPGYKNITVTIEVPGTEDMPIKCYRLKGEGADKLAVGDTITVTGTLTNYNGEIEFAQGCILEAVESGGGEAPVAPEDPVEILKAAFALAPGKSLPYACSLSGVITSVDYAYDASYGNITVTMNSNGYLVKCYRLKGAGIEQLNVNDFITVYGVITNYNGTIEFGAGCTLMGLVNNEPPYEAPDPTPDTTLSVAEAIAVGQKKTHNGYTAGKYYVTGVVTEVYNSTYGNMYISDGTGTIMVYGTWSADGSVRYDGMPNKPVAGDTVTLYGVIGQYGGNPQLKNAWIVSHTPAGGEGEEEEPTIPGTAPAGEIKADTAYKFGMVQGNLENQTYYLTGKMNGYYMDTTTDASAAVDVFLEETEGGYYFYALVDEAKVYINMVVSGTHVNGAFEAAPSTVYTYDAEKGTLIANIDGADYWFGTRNDKTYTTMGPCKVEYAGFYGQFYLVAEEKTLSQQLEEASNLANGEYLDYVTTIEGVVSEIKYAYSEQYGNISFYVDVDGTKVYCYRVTGEGMDTLAVGDTVKVEGYLTAYNGSAQFDKTATVTVIAKAEVEEEKTLEEQLAEASELANGEYLDYVTTIEGVVSEIKYAYSEQYGNISFYVNVDGVSVYCYRVTGEGMDTLAVGDTVKVEGFLTAYNGTAQFDKTATVTVIAKADTEDGSDGEENPPVDDPVNPPADETPVTVPEDPTDEENPSDEENSSDEIPGDDGSAEDPNE